MKYNLNVAVIGTGFIGKQHIDFLKARVKNLIICSADIETGSSIANELGTKFYSDYEEMFRSEKLDFVSVCLPTHLHYAAVKKAFEYKINVLCEKPFSTDVETAKDMVKSAEENNLTLMVGHCVRFSKAFEYLRRCVNDKRFGKLMSLEIYRHSESPTWSIGGWLHNPSLSGGAVRDLHIHDTDIVSNILGMPKAVYTSGNPFLCHTVYDFGKDISVYASASWRNVSEYEFESGYDAIFENGCINMNNNKVVAHTKDGVFEPLETEEFADFYSCSESLENEIEYFCRCIQNGLKPELCMPRDSVNTMILSCAESESMESGKAVEINL